MPRPDLVFMKQGNPVAVVEAKGRPVPSSFEDAVRHQLRHYAAATSSPWSILVDPDRTTIFRSLELTRPWSSFSTREVLRTVNIRSEAIGERALLAVISLSIRCGDGACNGSRKSGGGPMIHVVEARYARDYVIGLRFSDGLAGEVDLRDGPVFEPLRQLEAFQSVRLHPELHTIVWPSGADLAPEFLHERVRVPA